MNKAEELKSISKKNYNKAEQMVNIAIEDIYVKAERAANKGLESIKYELKDSLYTYMIKRKLRDAGFTVVEVPSETDGYTHAIIIDWGE